MNKYIKWTENNNAANNGFAHVITNDGNIYWNILSGKVNENTAIAFLYSDIFKEEYKKAIEEIKNENRPFVIEYTNDEQKAKVYLKILDENKYVIEERMIFMSGDDYLPTKWSMKITDIFKMVLNYSKEMEKSNSKNFKKIAMETSQAFKFEDVPTDLIENYKNNAQVMNPQDNIEDLI